MEQRYDGYYKKELPYKMTLKELQAAPYMSEAMILAYIRQVGPEKLHFVVYAHPPQNITLVPFMGIALCSGDRVPTLCRMVEEDNDLYNPLNEGTSSIHRQHWYHPYKIKFTPVDFEGPIERYYFSDFCSLFREGHIQIIEVQ